MQGEYKKDLERQAATDPSIVVVTADFVSWFARDGVKVRDLVLVLLRRKVTTYVHCVNWGNTAGCDMYFVADAVKHVLLRTSLFHGVATMHWFSDHGSCFDNARTFYVMSCMHNATAKLRASGAGVDVNNGFMSEYHGAGRADDAGAAASAAYSPLGTREPDIRNRTNVCEDDERRISRFVSETDSPPHSSL